MRYSIPNIEMDKLREFSVVIKSMVSLGGDVHLIFVGINENHI